MHLPLSAGDLALLMTERSATPMAGIHVDPGAQLLALGRGFSVLTLQVEAYFLELVLRPQLMKPEANCL